jgi:isopentenyl-diphosphate delta-isomerase
MTIEDDTLRDTFVELVDPLGRAIGATTKMAAHEPPGQLHRAFSVFLVAPDGRVLIQRRALTKYHSAGLWSNTCCGHPAPGEDVLEAASRRLADELGLRMAPSDLRIAAQLTYQLADRISGRTEREYDHVLIGRSTAMPIPNEHEVAEVVFESLDNLGPTQITQAAFTAWFPLVMNAALPALTRLPSRP